MDKGSIADQKYEKLLKSLVFQILIFLVCLDLSAYGAGTSFQKKSSSLGQIPVRLADQPVAGYEPFA
jgi:hypothetical protein